ncbi:MAG: ABC transporter permease [Caldilineaceae bacterium]
MWLSALAIQYRDVRFAIQFLTQFLMYAAPVVWPVSLIPAQYRLLYGLYPMAGVIEGFRAALIGTTPNAVGSDWDGPGEHLSLTTEWGLLLPTHGTDLCRCGVDATTDYTDYTDFLLI